MKYFGKNFDFAKGTTHAASFDLFKYWGEIGWNAMIYKSEAIIKVNKNDLDLHKHYAYLRM